MKRIIRNQWARHGQVLVADILSGADAPEGLAARRLEFEPGGRAQLAAEHGYYVSIVGGRASLTCASISSGTLPTGTHVFLPPGEEAVLSSDDADVVVVEGGPSRVRGKAILVRCDEFLAGCCLEDGPRRWMLTPQYVSRRAFLHHDRTFVGRDGAPISWCHTTMFDVTGLPPNEEGMPVFKMSYDFRTEPNFCYAVEGDARVRFAEHPYRARGQRWLDWQALDGDTTYHLAEPPDAAEQVETEAGLRPRRNKHEIYIDGGYVSLMCMHSPAPTGAETHAAGEYSSYGDEKKVIGTPAHTRLIEEMRPLDEMVNALSLARVTGQDVREHQQWATYEQGLEYLQLHQARLLDAFPARRSVLERWHVAPPRT